MDYEQKYKDALAWVESIYPELNHEHQMEAEAFFSELAESEDERIIKAINEAIKDAHVNTLEEYGSSCKEACDWLKVQLKKQKEQKHIKWSNGDEKIRDDSEYAALLHYPKMSRVSEPHGVIPADNKSHYLGDANEDNRKAFIVGAQWQKEQNPTWSEDDEKMKDLIISVLEVNHSKGIFKVGLRAIRTEEIVSWLKSLKQRYTWKPSEDQMDAMKMAVSYFGYSWVSKEQKLLESLYNDLKKLTDG